MTPEITALVARLAPRSHYGAKLRALLAECAAALRELLKDAAYCQAHHAPLQLFEAVIAERDALAADLENVQTENDRLASENAGLRKDAERYQEARSSGTISFFGEQLIDAAMEQPKSKP